MIDADEAEFKRSGTPLFSSHMIDLSEGSLHPKPPRRELRLTRSRGCRLQHRDHRQVPQALCSHEAVARDGDRK